MGLDDFMEIDELIQAIKIEEKVSVENFCSIFGLRYFGEPFIELSPEVLMDWLPGIYDSEEEKFEISIYNSLFKGENISSTYSWILIDILSLRVNIYSKFDLETKNEVYPRLLELFQKWVFSLIEPHISLIDLLDVRETFLDAINCFIVSTALNFIDSAFEREWKLPLSSLPIYVSVLANCVCKLSEEYREQLQNKVKTTEREPIFNLKYFIDLEGISNMIFKVVLDDNFSELNFEEIVVFSYAQNFMELKDSGFSLNTLRKVLDCED